jgi:uncharacterized membrane protein YphA (DoxX/SURF4 family)/thiol-disulfide isomerase/thioredoxin
MGTVVLFAQLLLAVVFATAAVGKLLDLKGSRRAMADFGVPTSLAPALGTILPFAELAVAILLVPSATARWGALGAFVLLIGFIAGISVALSRGKAPDCHCFGQIHSEPAGKSTLIRNVVLAALALLVIVHGAGTPVDDWVSARSAAELAAVGLGISTAALIGYVLFLRHDRAEYKEAFEVTRHELESVPPGLPVGVPAPHFALPDIDGDMRSMSELLSHGQAALLIFAGPSCGACKAMMPQVGRWQAALEDRLTIAVMTGGEVEANVPWTKEHGVSNVILQDDFDVMGEYRVRATPSAVIVTPDSRIASLPAVGEASIEALVRLALEKDLTDSLTRSGSNGSES